MPRPKTIPIGRKNHLAFAVSAEFLRQLDQLRVKNAEWGQISDGQLVKRLALLKINDLLNI